MAIYLKQFSTHSEYNAYINGSDAILPNVSICTTEGDVHYNPDPYAGHDYVEIGGLKWATMNIGATRITDTGLYFQWGDISGYTAAQCGSGEGQKYFGWADYKYGNGTSSPSATGITKYNSTDGKTVLDLSDDAARANWRGGWRIPTEADYQALSAATTNEWVTDYEGSGVNGRLFTSKTESNVKLFFPAVGNCNNGSISNVGSVGYYWSASLATSSPIYSKYLAFSSNECAINAFHRFIGRSVRDVAD